MIKFLRPDDYFILHYEPSEDGLSWLYHKIDDSGSVRLRYTFTLEEKHFDGKFPTGKKLEKFYDKQRNGEGPDSADFKIGNMVKGKYYKLDRNVLSIEYDLYIHSEIAWTVNEFIAVRNISVFRKLDKQGLKSLYIGGEHSEAMPESEFRRLLRRFPTTHELNRYADARINSIVGEFSPSKLDHEKRYQSYLNNKLNDSEIIAPLGISEYEIQRFENVLERLQAMLADEVNYSELRWQKEVLNIIRLIYPKYIQVFEEAPVWDELKKKRRKIDFLLLEADGNVDIIEIKKPFDKSIVTERCYRDNHVPLRELSGSIMQVEKYIFHLNRSGEKGEAMLTKKYKDDLPEDFNIKITNPSGVIIMGRSKGLTDEQKADFEVIKRKYNNIIDILTYDDLLNRIKVMINGIKLNAKKSHIEHPEHE